jgi:hypothetical protein
MAEVHQAPSLAPRIRSVPALCLFLDGEPVEVVDEEDGVRGHLAGLARR